MDEKKLPKLEIEGFKNIPDKPYTSRWKNKTENVAQKMGTHMKKVLNTEKPTQKDEDTGYKRLLIKTGVCAGIAIIILAISSINTPITNDITQAIDKTVNHEFDIEEDIGRLKFVQNLDEDTQSVFSPLPDAVVVFPADGEIITHYGEGGSKGVRIAPVDGQIVCIAKGTVTAVGEIDNNGYVQVKLDSGETVMFYNITPTVLEDDIVLPGQPIGTVAGDYVYLEMQNGEEYIDPIQYIKQRAALVVQ